MNNPSEPRGAGGPIANQKPVWDLQDRIESGTLTPKEKRDVSRLVGAIGGIGDTDSPAQALAHWRHVRELLQRALGEQPGGAS